MPRQHLNRLYSSTLLACLAAGLLACNEDAAVPSAPHETSPALAAAAAPSFLSVTAGWDHTCGISTGSRAFCWGNNQFGQLGTFDKRKRLVATAVTRDLPFDGADGGTFNACAVATDGLAYCWGQNLPNGTTTRPVPVSRTLRFTQVTAGYNHFCGLTAAGKAYCRGANEGLLGDGTATERSTPVPVVGGHVFRQISTGDYHTCAVTADDRAYCWGDNSFGQLGDGNTGEGGTPIRELQPTAVVGGLRFRQISAGGAFTCALTTDNRAYCWGVNRDGQLGDETLTDRPTPTAVHGGRRFLQLAAGENHVCAVNLSNGGFCWGREAEGQLGNGVFHGISHGMVPQFVQGGLSWRQMAAGGLHSCGVTTSNVAYCWGSNAKGQLGNGTQTSQAKPTRVEGPS